MVSLKQRLREFLSEQGVEITPYYRKFPRVACVHHLTEKPPLRKYTFTPIRHVDLQYVLS